MDQSFFVIFLGVQGKKNYFFGSISMLEIIFLGCWFVPQPEHPCHKYIWVPPLGRANRGKKRNFETIECSARNCIVNVKGKAKTAIAIKEQQNQYNLKIWKLIENGLKFLLTGDRKCMDTWKHPIVARHWSTSTGIIMKKSSRWS